MAKYKFRAILLIVSCIFSSITLSSFGDTPPKHTFEIGKDHFMLDGKPFQIRCGEMHFARVPREYWRHRIQMIKSLGMNTVCAYLF